MTQEKVEQIVFQAFLYAATQMGPRIKGMSCFLKNWQDIKVVHKARDSREAA